MRQDRVDRNGTVTLRYQSVLRHINLGRAHKAAKVRLLVAGAHVRIVREEDGQLLRDLTLDADGLYYGTSHGVHDVLRQVPGMS